MTPRAFADLMRCVSAGTISHIAFRGAALLAEGVCPSCLVALRRSRADDTRFKGNLAGERAWICTRCGQMYGLHLDGAHIG